MTQRTSTGRATRTSRRPVGASPAPRPSSATGGGPGGSAGGGRSRRWVLLVVGVVVGVQLGLLLGFLLPGQGDEPADGGTADEVLGPDGQPLDPDDPLAERIAELQAEEAERDAQAVQLLTEQTTGVLDLVSPVVIGAGEHTPGSPPPSAETVEQWRAALVSAEQAFGDPPSAGTDVNVARSGLSASLLNLETMVDAFALAASAQPADVEAALEVAASARRSAALSWSVGATQLDAVNVAADQGHVHLFLPPVPDSGALTPDPEPVAP
ncbi:hypothetical protein [Jannaschia sp. R86511]|uniref:hypothetical protein n=1 Tax=Jannaschia sp. R86511 TaxID=3093853 RepID=UPI0036D2E058